MHPTDLAAHRAQRQRAQIRALERDVARLLPHLNARNRVELRTLANAARDGATSLHDVHARVRARLADHARAA